LNQASSAGVAINTIRCLAIDMVEEANSGHPGAPMGQAALAYVLWTRFLRFNPDEPQWPNRDRFVLSCGHASALLYSLLHLSGYDLDIEELVRFRQLGSKTPGHPEHGLTPGVETTTGPLGQGLGNGVGMAMAERVLAAQFNRDGHSLFDHRTWVIVSDGDLMEGVASEACSLAGHLRLGKLNVIYDDNGITIDGETSLSFSEDVAGRFEAYGWHTQKVSEGNDLEDLSTAFAAAEAVTDRPSLILVRTHIGFGAPTKQDTAAAHGSALGAKEVLATKLALGWPTEPTFLVPEEAKTDLHAAADRGRSSFEQWSTTLQAYAEAHPGLSEDLQRRQRRELPAEWETDLPEWAADACPVATRKASGVVLNALQAKLTELIGGSADLTGSNNTFLDGLETALEAPGGRNLHFGVREHAMGAILNGMALSGLLRPYGGTFLVFSDYMRASIRLAALMKLPVVYVFTHDSIFLGEDGPTHQPEGHLASLRAIPGLTVIRPADALETTAAWRCALEQTEGPTALVLTRQELRISDETRKHASSGLPRGSYVLSEGGANPRAILVATGSEVTLALDAQSALAEQGIPVRVVSLPSWEIFERQSPDYRDEVLPPGGPRRLVLEAGSPLGWERYAGPGGEILGVTGFGASAPAADVAEKLGFTTENVVARVKAMLE